MKQYIKSTLWSTKVLSQKKYFFQETTLKILHNDKGTQIDEMSTNQIRQIGLSAPGDLQR